jgi:hypothetical protein
VVLRGLDIRTGVSQTGHARLSSYMYGTAILSKVRWSWMQRTSFKIMCGKNSLLPTLPTSRLNILCLGNLASCALFALTLQAYYIYVRCALRVLFFPLAA